MNNEEYCDAEHENALYGCYGQPNHEGKHWCYASKVKDSTGAVDKGYNRIWEWDDTAPTVPEGSVAVVLTEEQLFVIVGALGEPGDDPRMHALKVTMYEGLLELAKRK